MIPVILSGGSGTRLWPHSRKYFPKQFLAFVSEQTLFQDTLQRLDGLTMEAPLVICNEAHRFIVAEQLRQTSHHAQSILLEPVGRNTAPAVALAALQATAQDPDSILLVLPADHVIQNVTAFHQALAIAQQQAEAGKLVTFGIVPTAPETGFGYIQAGKTLTPPPLPQSGRGAKDSASSSSPLPLSGRGGRGGRVFPTPSTASSKNPTVPPPPNTLPAANITGTAACSCSRPAAIWKSLPVSALTFLMPARNRWLTPRPTWILCASMRPLLPPARLIPLTMPSWKKPVARLLCRWMQAGMMLAPGQPSGKFPARMRQATAVTVT